jgi:acetolactate decarboxylase
MLNRRRLFHTGLAAGCAACAGLASGRLSRVRAAAGMATPSEINGPGYALRFIGSQRETIMMGKRAALLGLRTLRDRPHVYGIGPLEGLTGEATIANGRPALARVGADHRVHVAESYDGGAPFFVWAEVPAWQAAKLPADVRSFKDLETFVGNAGAQAGLTQAFPFVMTGRPNLIDFHVVDAKPDTPPGMAEHAKIQIQFDVRQQEATFVGFWSSEHQGTFTPIGSNIHVHFQTSDNTLSGHVQGLDLAAGGMTLSLPKG